MHSKSFLLYPEICNSSGNTWFSGVQPLGTAQAALGTTQQGGARGAVGMGEGTCGRFSRSGRGRGIECLLALSQRDTELSRRICCLALGVRERWDCHWQGNGSYAGGGGGLSGKLPHVILRGNTEV